MDVAIHPPTDESTAKYFGVDIDCAVQDLPRSYARRISTERFALSPRCLERHATMAVPDPRKRTRNYTSSEPKHEFELS